MSPGRHAAIGDSMQCPRCLRNILIKTDRRTYKHRERPGNDAPYCDGGDKPAWTMLPQGATVPPRFHDFPSYIDNR